MTACSFILTGQGVRKGESRGALRVRCPCMSQGAWPAGTVPQHRQHHYLNWDWLYQGDSLSDAADAYRRHLLDVQEAA